VLGDPGQLREVQQQRLLGRGLGGEVEVLQGLVRRERGVPDPLARAGGVAGDDLGFQQDLEELFVSPALLARPFRGRLQPLADPWCLELCEQVGQPVAGGGHAQSSA
jgi:hypothetical protein